MTNNNIADGANYAPTTDAKKVVSPGEFNYAAAFLDHGHIYGQCNGLNDAGATLSKVFDPDSERLEKFCATYPQVQAVSKFDDLLEDPHIQLIACAAIPNRRADIGLATLRSGKDFFTDKSPFTTLAQLEECKQVCAHTGQKYMVYYAERVHNDAAWMAGDMITEGKIGRVLQVLNLAPHRLAKDTRPNWFFQKDCYGGILTDIGSHQVEQFLSYASCKDAQINFARACNFNNKDKPELEDFGELSLTGDNGASFYSRVDWYTPDGLATWGDGRSFITGTQGTIELRKYIDPARQVPASLLILVDENGEQQIDCLNKSGFPFFGQLIQDCLQRTETAMTQRHVFKAAEISMQAQAIADEQQQQLR